MQRRADTRDVRFLVGRLPCIEIMLAIGLADTLEIGPDALDARRLGPPGERRIVREQGQHETVAEPAAHDRHHGAILTKIGMESADGRAVRASRRDRHARRRRPSH